MADFDVSECAEAKAWAYQPNALGLALCGCGIAATPISERGGSSELTRRVFRHTLYRPTTIVYEPEATAFAYGVMLGPGLHRAIEYTRFVEHKCMDGVGVMYEYEFSAAVE